MMTNFIVFLIVAAFTGMFWAQSNQLFTSSVPLKSRTI